MTRICFHDPDIAQGALKSVISNPNRYNSEIWSSDTMISRKKKRGTPCFLNRKMGRFDQNTKEGD